MISTWSNQEISSVLLQLEQRNLPLPGYRFCREGDQCRLLGSGSFALVYDALDKKGRNRCAIKVMGFGDKRVDPEEFRKTMDAQTLMSIQSRNIVKIYGYSQLRVWLDGNNRVTDVAAVSDMDEVYGDNSLLLQFAVMEKLTPVLSVGRNRRPVLNPQELASGDEKEVLRLGDHLVKALIVLHNNKILHRDIKLENIFYDSRHRRYKLGDFGIAKATLDGLASTVAFTKGYGAPEIVGMPEDRYDGTADIYSLGMVLFVLLNGLRFPGSDRYHVNAAVQYCPGYVLPDPKWGSKAVAQLLRKMCSYHPDDRQPSIKAVSRDLDHLGFSPAMRRRLEEDKTMLVLGVVLFCAGAGILMLCRNYPESLAFFETIPWLSPLLLSLGALFGCQGLISTKNMLVSASLRQNYSGMLWGLIMAMYAGLIVVSLLPVRDSGTISDFFGVTVPAVIRQIQGGKIGVFGLSVCAIWLLRDRIRAIVPEKNRENISRDN